MGSGFSRIRTRIPPVLSRSSVPGRLPGMTETRSAERWLLAGLVLAHLAVSILHGRAHAEAHVGLSLAATQFVYAAVLIAPLVGLVLLLTAPKRSGAWLLALSMAAACVFGLVNHFILQSPDHISQVSGPWGRTFAVTAVLLALSEAAASTLAVRQALLSRRLS